MQRKPLLSRGCMSGFDSLGLNAAPVYDASAITPAEATQIQSMRDAIGPLPDYVIDEVSHDFFFCRFLRGYQHDVKQATQAYRDMLAYRGESSVKAVHDELVAANLPWPWDMDRFSALRECVGPRGHLHLHTQDLAGNILTHTMVESTLNGMRAAIKAGLTDDYVKMFSYLDEYMLIRQHKLCVERGHMVGEHMIVDVSGVGMFSFGGGVLDLLKKFGKSSKHYAERLTHIDDVNNSRVAMFIWPAIAPFIPKHTASKLRVSGKDYAPCAGLSRSLDLWAAVRLASTARCPRMHQLTQRSSPDPHHPPQDAAQADRPVGASRTHGRHLCRPALEVL